MRKHVAATGVAALLVGLAAAIAAPASAYDQPSFGVAKTAVGSDFGNELPLTPVSQQNAVRSALDYLDYTAFSRQGLIRQLEYDGFSTADATYAVDSITVDWNEQAAKSAMDYLDYTSFSRSGLISQLMYDGFTAEQAAYGVATTGL